MTLAPLLDARPPSALHETALIAALALGLVQLTPSVSAPEPLAHLRQPVGETAGRFGHVCGRTGEGDTHPAAAV